MDRSGAKVVEARSAQLDRSGVLRLNAEHAVVHAGSVGVATAKEARIVRSRVFLLRSDTAHLESGARVLLHIGGGPAKSGAGGAAAAGVAGAGFAIGALVLLDRIVFGLIRGRPRQ